jgi:hypothetical protein
MLLKLEYERDKLKMEDKISETSRVKFAGLRARLEKGETTKQDRIVDRIVSHYSVRPDGVQS